jgi:Family of unknown function (DUF6188)
MHGLPPDFDAGIFVGRRFDSLTFYQYVVAFRFTSVENSIVVSVESSFSVIEPGRTPIRVTLPVESSNAMHHVGKVVASAIAMSEGTLNLTMDDGTMLRFHDDQPRYESYNIELPGGRVIAV